MIFRNRPDFPEPDFDFPDLAGFSVAGAVPARSGIPEKIPGYFPRGIPHFLYGIYSVEYFLTF